MDKPRFRKYLLLFVFLVFLSQIETACSDGGPAFKEQAVPSGNIHNYGVTSESDREAPGAPAGRKVIVSHTLAVEVGDIGPAFESAVRLANDNGGYTTSTGRYRQPDGSMRGSITMRVPSDRVDDVMAGLRTLGKVISEGSAGEDITEQYADLDARLSNARASEKRLSEMMNRRTEKLADVLAVERELTRVRGEIESMEARKRSWDTLTRMVTISVELTEPPRALPSAQKFWRPLKTAFGEALEGFAQSLHYAIIFVGAVIPWLAVFGFMIFVILKIVKKRKSRQQ